MDAEPVPRRTRIVPDREFVRAGFFTSLGVALLSLLVLMLWKLSGAVLEMIAPFLAAGALALLLDPLVDRLERSGLRRFMAVLLVFGFFLIALIALISLAVPALVNQANQLALEGPRYIANLKAATNDFLAHHRHIGNYTLPANFDKLSAQFSTKATELLNNSAGRITAVLVGSISTALDTVITLIVTFFLLMDIDRLRARLFYLLPENARAPARLFSRDVGNVFADYLRGLLTVSALYGLFTLLLMLGLSVVHPELRSYALLIGVVGGVLYSIPYLGPFVTALITFLVAFAAGGAAFGGGAIALTLVLNQVFDNVVTPRVVGGGVGLHPVASIFALTLGGTLFGLWGLLLSVPVAASIQVILFRLFPKLSSPTPPVFLKRQQVVEDEVETEHTESS